MTDKTFDDFIPCPSLERPLPVGVEEFNQFASRIIAQAGPYADEDSMRWVLATSILHADGKKANFTDQYFIDVLRRAAANQVASQIMNDIKVKQDAARQQAEAAALQEAADNEKENSF